MNAIAGKKFRKSEWLISTILLKVNHLGWVARNGIKRTFELILGYRGGKTKSGSLPVVLVRRIAANQGSADIAHLGFRHGI